MGNNQGRKKDHHLVPISWQNLFYKGNDQTKGFYYDLRYKKTDKKGSPNSRMWLKDAYTIYDELGQLSDEVEDAIGNTIENYCSITLSEFIRTVENAVKTKQDIEISNIMNMKLYLLFVFQQQRIPHLLYKNYQITHDFIKRAVVLSVEMSSLEDFNKSLNEYLKLDQLESDGEIKYSSEEYEDFKKQYNRLFYMYKYISETSSVEEYNEGINEYLKFHQPESDGEIKYSLEEYVGFKKQYNRLLHIYKYISETSSVEEYNEGINEYLKLHQLESDGEIKYSLEGYDYFKSRAIAAAAENILQDELIKLQIQKNDYNFLTNGNLLNYGYLLGIKEIKELFNQKDDDSFDAYFKELLIRCKSKSNKIPYLWKIYLLHYAKKTILLSNEPAFICPMLMLPDDFVNTPIFHIPVSSKLVIRVEIKYSDATPSNVKVIEPKVDEIKKINNEFIERTKSLINYEKKDKEFLYRHLYVCIPCEYKACEVFKKSYLPNDSELIF